MKELIVTLISLWMGSLSVWAIENCSLQQAQTIAATAENEEREIELNIMEDEGINTFSLFYPTAYATLYNKVVSVDLSELPEGATVTITRTTTGEEVYSQTGMGSMEIDLSTCGKGRYQIDVVSGGLWLQGEFIL